MNTFWVLTVSERRHRNSVPFQQERPELAWKKSLRDCRQRNVSDAEVQRVVAYFRVRENEASTTESVLSSDYRKIKLAALSNTWAHKWSETAVDPPALARQLCDRTPFPTNPARGSFSLQGLQTLQKTCDTALRPQVRRVEASFKTPASQERNGVSLTTNKLTILHSVGEGWSRVEKRRQIRRGEAIAR